MPSPEKDSFDDIDTANELLNIGPYQVICSNKVLSVEHCQIIGGLKYFRSANVLHREFLDESCLDLDESCFHLQNSVLGLIGSGITVTKKMMQGIKKEEGDRVELDADKEVAEEIVKEVAIQVDDTKIVTDVGDQVVEDQNNCTLEVVDTNISELHNSKMDDCYKVALQVATVERVDDDIDKPKEEKSIEFITTTTVDEHSLEAIQLSTIGVHVPLEKDILMAGNNFLDTKGISG
ncbi:hypothetical protein RHGRI_025534 [Rhododendron griersonianum]|uniref:Uncharacterized protein n=1 Tax=Rhododendron griersonianum TaxID=479676 RepID=A0AAV6IQ13_9ERIC|nr:hypothetical protein RHGRI_025534 [Rhododendron griersonianum]